MFTTKSLNLYYVHPRGMETIVSSPTLPEQHTLEIRSVSVISQAQGQSIQFASQSKGDAGYYAVQM